MDAHIVKAGSLAKPAALQQMRVIDETASAYGSLLRIVHRDHVADGGAGSADKVRPSSEGPASLL